MTKTRHTKMHSEYTLRGVGANTLVCIYKQDLITPSSTYFLLITVAIILKAVLYGIYSYWDLFRVPKSLPGMTTSMYSDI